MFKPLNGDNAVLRQNGVFRVAPLYIDRTGRLFAKHGTGFVALKATADTSVVGLLVEEIDTEAQLFVSPVGNLFAGDGPNRRALDDRRDKVAPLMLTDGSAGDE
jgi:hypothetical protein